MTSLDARYRLLKCVALGGGIRTHNALETATGRPVMVHILDGVEPDAADRLRERVSALPVADRLRILEVATTASGFAVVSEFLTGLTTFPEWLDARAPATGPVAEPETKSEPAVLPGSETMSFAIGTVESSRDAVPKALPPGEFTQLFQGIDRPATGDRATPPVAPVPPIATPPATSPPIASVAPTVEPPATSPPARPARGIVQPPGREQSPLKPGEFTAMFRPGGPPTPADSAASPLGAASTPPPAPSFGAPPNASPRGAPATPPFAASSSAAFAAPAPPVADPRPALGTPAGAPPVARYPLAWSPLASSPPAGAPAVPPPAFGPPPLAHAPATASPLGVPPSPLSGAASGQAPLPSVIPPPVFTTPGAAGSGGAGVPASPLAAHRGGAPSDYTMLIRQSATPPMPTPPAAPPTLAPTAPKRSTPLGLIIALNVVLVLAIALVLYFVFRPAPPDAAPGGPLPDSLKALKAVKAKVPAITAPAVPAVPAPPPLRP